MSNERGHRVFVTLVGDDTWLAASVDSPRFCVGASSREEAFERAARALRYFAEVKDRLHVGARPVETCVISPFFEEKELCAAG